MSEDDGRSGGDVDADARSADADALDADELAEAEALARALERGSGGDELPEDALEAAALIRYSLDGGELPRDREDAILAEVLQGAQRAAERRPAPSRRPWWMAIFGLGFAGAAAAAVVAILIWRGLPTAPAIPENGAPAPGLEVVRASMGRLEGADHDEAFDAAMRGYRAGVYDALSERYDAR